MVCPPLFAKNPNTMSVVFGSQQPSRIFILCVNEVNERSRTLKIISWDRQVSQVIPPPKTWRYDRRIEDSVSSFTGEECHALHTSLLCEACTSVSAVISFRSETAVAVTSRGMCVCVCDRTATSPYRTYLTVILVPPKPAVVATVTPQRFGYAGGVFAVELVLVAPVLLPLCGNKKSNQFLLRFVLRR
jgi:hypothetical protein